MLSAAIGRVHPLLGALCLCLLLSACAHHRYDKSHYLKLPVERSQELADTPFFAQEAFQCGPAAMAMVLNTQGVEVSPQALQPRLYLPGRRGTLQAEMLAAAAHYGQLAVVIPASLDSLLREVSAGHPVVVLQNVGFQGLPVWHYAVVIGYDLDKEEIYLRSGTQRRRTYAFGAFLKTWAGSHRWAMVVVAPGTVPVSATERDYLSAASALERSDHPQAALRAFEAANSRWPDSYLAWAGSGNAAFALARFSEAERAYRQALRIQPGNASLMNNLALAQAKRGCRQMALAVVDCALQQVPDDANLAVTRKEIEALSAGAETCQAFVCGPVAGQ